jgi:hypothetical protein
MPHTQVSFAPPPRGSTRATALQCGQRFASPVTNPQRAQAP